MRKKSIYEYLEQFWAWAETTEVGYACGDKPISGEPFCFPQFGDLVACCLRALSENFASDEISDFLTCMALDDEEETILDACKSIADMSTLERLVEMGIKHPQPNARWQIAELLRCRNVSKRSTYLRELRCDENAYVRRRAQNATLFLQNSGEEV